MRTRLLTVVSLLMLLFVAVVAPASAMSGAALVSYTIACDATSITYGQIDFDRDNTGSNIESYTFSIVDGNGTTLFAVTSGVPVGDSISAQTEDFFYVNAPTKNPIRVRFVSNAGNGFGEQVVWDFSGDCPDLPSSQIGAPGIPAGFVFATIICDTPVYNTQSGQPVGDAHITAGQTWYVNPTPVEGDDGQQWTEIYVSSTTNPFIPTVCVQR